MPLVKLIPKPAEWGDVAALNARVFGRKDYYSDPEHLAQGLTCIRRMRDGELVGYLLYKGLPEYISLERIGTLPKYRKAGIARSLLRSLSRIAKAKRLPIRTYLSYDNLPSYLLHIKSGFHPTHIAWNRWVWIEWNPPCKIV